MFFGVSVAHLVEHQGLAMTWPSRLSHDYTVPGLNPTKAFCSLSSSHLHVEPISTIVAKENNFQRYNCWGDVVFHRTATTDCKLLFMTVHQFDLVCDFSSGRYWHILYSHFFQIITIGRHVKGYHYIVANLVSHWLIDVLYC